MGKDFYRSRQHVVSYLSAVCCRLCNVSLAVTAQFLRIQGIVKVGAVDANEHQNLGSQYGVQGFPTIKIFGSNKYKPENYEGEHDSGPALGVSMPSRLI